jgi:hypothetical protein
MNNEMQKRLTTLVGTDILVSVFTDFDEPESFLLGYLLQIDNNNILMNMVNSFGEEDGFCTINLSDIFIFDEDKMYSGKIQKLFEIKKQTRKYIAILDTNPIGDILKYAVGNNLLIEVNEDDNYIGYVSSFSEQTLVIEIIDNYCNDIGVTTIDMEYINTLKCQNKFLKDLELLYTNK